ncbi:MAG: hypothetical protein JW913_18870 [Chitinispirillaceae bacterium]|nr:hypothetical protein [Chitinispirillaceae bacterium]
MEPRSTPYGLIDQLVESYEMKRIDLFVDLLPRDGSFQFFIAPDFFNEYRLKYQQLSEQRDTRLNFITQSDYYYYWTQDAEIERHERLFRYAGIEFLSKPGLESVRKFIDNGDSLAELLVTGGMFVISRFFPDTVEQYPVSIDRQVFLIKKDPDGLWVIRKWYDFSSGTGE